MKNLPTFTVALSSLSLVAYIFLAAPVSRGRVAAGQPDPAAATAPADAAAEVAKPPAEAEKPPAEAAAEAATPAAKTGSTRAMPNAGAHDELKKAREKLRKISSIRAQVVQQVNIFELGFTGRGRYLQAPDHKMRYELKIELPQTVGTFEEVSDGNILYSRHEIRPLPSKTEKTSVKAVEADKDVSKAAKSKVKASDPQVQVMVTRKNVKKILDEAARHPDASVKNSLTVDLGLGGVAALLGAIERAMKFNAMKTETLRGHPVVVIEGTWTADQLTTWLGKDAPRGTPLPSSIPDIGRLYLDAETGFPHRLMYLKRVPDRAVLRSMLQLDFLDVTLDEPIDPKEFVFAGGGDADTVDLTQDILNQLAAPEPQAQPEGEPGVPGVP